MKMLDLVPQVYFDLIARVAPGGLFLLLLPVVRSREAVATKVSSSLAAWSLDGAVAWVVFAVAAWTVGHLMSPVTWAFERIADALNRPVCKECPELFAKRSFVRTESSAAGGRLTKMRAEYHMLLSSTVALLLLAWLTASPATGTLRLWLAVAAVVTLGGAAARYHEYKTGIETQYVQLGGSATCTHGSPDDSSGPT